MRRIVPFVGSLCVFLVVLLARIDTAAHLRITTTVTWDREISAIVGARCLGCHASSDALPLATYEDARPWARAIKHEIVTRQMPVWRAARGYGEFANDPSLSPFEIALVVAWVDGGAPKSIALPTTTPQPAVAPALPLATFQRPAAREIRMPCATRPFTNQIVGLRPHLGRGGSARVVARLPGGQQQLLGWFRDVDPADDTTYWLRRPLDAPPGSRVSVTASAGPCELSVFVR